MKHYQGDDIPFELKLKNGKWSDFDAVDLYFYTNESFVVRYSTVNSDYNELAIDNNCIKGIISSSDSALMCGNLIVEIRVQKDEENACKRLNTNVEIYKTTIKQEVL